MRLWVEGAQQKVKLPLDLWTAREPRWADAACVWVWVHVRVLICFQNPSELIGSINEYLLPCFFFFFSSQKCNFAVWL